MSASNMEDPLTLLVNYTKQQKILAELKKLDDLSAKLKPDEPQVPVKKIEPTVRWRKRDKDGNVIYKNPRSTRKQSNQSGHSQKTNCPSNSNHSQVGFAPEAVESFVQELQRSLDDASDDLTEPSPPKAPLASLD